MDRYGIKDPEPTRPMTEREEIMRLEAHRCFQNIIAPLQIAQAKQIARTQTIYIVKENEINEKEDSMG